MGQAPQLSWCRALSCPSPPWEVAWLPPPGAERRGGGRAGRLRCHPPPRLPAHSRGPALWHPAAAEEDQAREEAPDLVPQVVPLPGRPAASALFPQRRSIKPINPPGCPAPRGVGAGVGAWEVGGVRPVSCAWRCRGPWGGQPGPAWPSGRPHPRRRGVDTSKNRSG